MKRGSPAFQAGEYVQWRKRLPWENWRAASSQLRMWKSKSWPQEQPLRMRGRTAMSAATGRGTATDFCRIADLRSHPARQIDQRLALIFGRMLLGVGIENRPLGFAFFRQRDGVVRLWA